MNRDQYQDYLDKFNSKNYDGVLDYYAPDGQFELVFFGTKMTTRKEIKDFYGFFHDHVKEEIIVHDYATDGRVIAMEATVRVTGLKDLTKEAGAANGISIEYPIAKGDVIEVPQFIHYHLKDGKIVKALCALFQPAA